MGTYTDDSVREAIADTADTATNTAAIAADKITDPVVTLAAATYDTLVTDEVILCTYTDTGVCTITAQSAQIAVAGRHFVIVDAGQGAGTYTITLATEGSETITGASTIEANGGALNVYSDGTNLFTY